MSKPLQVLYEEHESIAAVLHALCVLLREVRRGATDFLTVAPDHLRVVTAAIAGRRTAGVACVVVPLFFTAPLVCHIGFGNGLQAVLPDPVAAAVLGTGSFRRASPIQVFGGSAVLHPAVVAASKFRGPPFGPLLQTVRPSEVLGIESSPAFVRAPEGNGCAERVIRTLKEQLLWIRTFATVEDLRVALIAWAELYNREWLIERHGFKPPTQARRAYYEHHEKLAA